MSIYISAKIGNDIVKIAYPFSFNNLKDEALDEAQITFYNARKDAYLPNTPVRITIKGVTIRTYSYVVANDHSVEMPIGSKRYKHSMGLIEETKILEGIVCPSLTFTNSISALGGRPLFADDVQNVNISGRFDYPQGFTSPNINSPILIDKQATFPSAEELGEEIIDYIARNTSNATFSNFTVVDTMSGYSSGVKIEYKSNTNTNTFAYDETPSITPTVEDTLEITYSIVYSMTITQGTSAISEGVWVITFNVEAANEEISRPWSITDCVLRVLECSEPIFEGENPRFTFDGITYAYGVASSPLSGSQAAKYSTVEAPEFSMTKCTLREQLKLIGSFIHGEPRLNNGVITFDEYGVGTPAEIELFPYVRRAPTIDINNYISEIRSSASNVVSNSDSDVAIIEQFGRAVSSVIVNERVTADNGVLITDKPIHSIHKVYADIRTANDDEYIVDADITPYILEATDYSTLASDYSGDLAHSKAMSIYYTIGQPNIGGLFYIAPVVFTSDKYYAISRILAVANEEGQSLDDIQSILENDITALRLRVVYTPFYNAEISHGKGELNDNPSNTLIYNQSENKVDTQYLGEAIKAVAARLGNVEEERTYYLTENDLDKIPSTSETINGLYISSVACEVMPYSVKCTVSLSKDFRRINPYVGINSIKRMWEVSEREVYDRDIIIKDTLAVSLSPIENAVGGVVVHDVSSVYRMFRAAVSSWKKQPINYATATTHKKNEDAIATLNYPVNTSSFGNVTHCTFFAKDNYSAGISLEKVTDMATNITGYWTKDVPYGDLFGRAYWLSFSMSNGGYSSETSGELSYPTAGITGQTPPINTEQNSENKPLRLRKDSRERITVTCELEAKSLTPSLVIGSALAELNDMVYKGDDVSLVLVRFKNDVTLDKFATTLDMITSNSSYYDKYTLNGENTILSNSNGILTATVNKSPNLGYGYAICTDITDKTVSVIDDNEAAETYTKRVGGKILFLCTAKEVQSAPLNIYFKIIKNKGV